MIIASIDVTLLDKSRFKKITRKNGQEATFVELVLIETPDSQFGDFMIKQGTTKEEREQKIELPILGDAKYPAGGQPRANTSRTTDRPSSRPTGRPLPTRPAPAPSPELDPASESDIPF
jgi:hypothetical protein